MTRQEGRGKRLFLILAAFIILQKLAGIAIALAGDLAEVRWLKSIIQPAGIALGVSLLWSGHRWLQWLVGLACTVSGGLATLVCGLVIVKLARATPADQTSLFWMLAVPLGAVGLLGLLNVGAGLLFWYSPSLEAFFRYQREGPDRGEIA